MMMGMTQNRTTLPMVTPTMMPTRLTKPVVQNETEVDGVTLHNVVSILTVGNSGADRTCGGCRKPNTLKIN